MVNRKFKRKRRRRFGTSKRMVMFKRIRTPRRRRAAPRMGFPAKRRAKLVYETIISVDPAAGVMAHHIFCANGAFDPDITGVGHQPMGFDEMMGLYEHYWVLGSKISVQWHTSNEVAGNAYICTLGTKADSTPIPGITKTMETPRFQHALMTTLHGSRSTVRLSTKYSTKKFHSGRDVTDEIEFRGNDASNPVIKTYFHVGLGPADATSNLGAQFCTVRITYITLFTTPRALAQS